MKLTRRDALKALGVGGATGGGLAVSETLVRTDFSAGDSSLSDGEFATLEAVAETVYPSAVEVTPAFLETHVTQLDDERTKSMASSIADLDEFTQSRYGRSFHDLSRSKRDIALRALGVDRAASRPAGNQAEQIRFHLVNSLLYLLFSRPKGSRLAGIENPDGYPGGFAVYSDRQNAETNR